MDSAAYKLKFGVSKTAYKNMVKQGILSRCSVKKTGEDKELIGQAPTTTDLAQWRSIKRERKDKIDRIQKKKHDASVLHRRTKGKPRKRRDGKTRGSVGPRQR